MRYYQDPTAHLGTVTTDECRGILAGAGFSGLGADQAAEQIGERAIVKGVEGIWIKKPAVVPTGYVKHEYSKKRHGWIFVVRPAGGSYSHDLTSGQTTFTPVAPRAPGAPLGPTSVPGAAPLTETILAQEGRAAAATSTAIMADQPGAVAIVGNPIKAEMDKAGYKDALRSSLQTMKLIEAALIIGNVAPPVPQIPPRPPGIKAGDTILRLEKKVEEFLIVRIPFAMKTSGGVDMNPWPRPAGGMIEPPNAPSLYPGESLSPGAGQPELPFLTTGQEAFTDPSSPYYVPGYPGGVQALVDSDAVLSAPQATNEFGSGRATEPSNKTWWLVAGAAALGAWFILRRR